MSAPAADWVLVVDDNQAGRYAVSRMLRRGGYAVREAGTGTEALTLASENPRLVLLDVHLPDVDGHEVCRRLREDPRTHDLPILQMSASYVKGTDRARGLAGGADAYLVEPIDPEELLATVSTLLRLRDAERRARAAEADWIASFHAIRQGVCLVDGEGRIVRHNAGFSRALIGTEDALTGHLGDHLALSFPDLSATAAELPLGQTELRDGDRVLVATVDPVPGEGGRRVVVLEDVTEQTLRRGDLEKFAYFVSHDMREPLRAMSSFVQLLDTRLAPVLDDDTREMFGFVKDGAKRLDEMIRGFLAFARLPVRHDRVPLDRVLVRAQENLRAVIEERGASVVVAASLPTVLGNELALVQLFQNLIGNAIKFCPHLPQIRVASQVEGDVPVLEVTDNGPGIPPGERERVFEMFRRLSLGRSVPGNGMGLAICQRIVQAHGGRIWVEEAEGGGSRFRFTLGGGARANPSRPRG
jgi:signal transduction histidine kinase